MPTGTTLGIAPVFPGATHIVPRYSPTTWLPAENVASIGVLASAPSVPPIGVSASQSTGVAAAPHGSLASVSISRTQMHPVETDIREAPAVRPHAQSSATQYAGADSPSLFAPG